MEEIFEGTTMFLDVLVLTWMIYWMRYQARLIKSSLERNVQRVLDAGDRRGLATIAFVPFSVRVLRQRSSLQLQRSQSREKRSLLV